MGKYDVFVQRELTDGDLETLHHEAPSYYKAEHFASNCLRRPGTVSVAMAAYDDGILVYRFPGGTVKERGGKSLPYLRKNGRPVNE